METGRDVAFVEKLRALESLDLGNWHQLENINALRGLSMLRVLSLAYTQVRNVDALTDLVTLEQLDLLKCRNMVAPLALNALGTLTRLRYLILSHTPVRLLGVNPWLPRLQHLRELHLNGIPGIVSLEELSSLAQLRVLKVRDTSILSLKPLAALYHLVDLDADGVGTITDISPLASLSCLVSLRLGRTAVENVEALRSLTSLREIDLSCTRVRDFSPLWHLERLSRVYLCGIGVVSQSQIEQLSIKRHLYINHMNVLSTRGIIDMLSSNQI